MEESKKQFKTFLTINGHIDTARTPCIICNDMVTVINTTAKDNPMCVCSGCQEILDNGNTLVIESVYTDEDKIVGDRVMVLPKEEFRTNVPLVVISHEEFDMLYERYKSKNN